MSTIPPHNSNSSPIPEDSDLLCVNRQEALVLLKDWVKLHDEVFGPIEKFMDFTGAMPDCKLWDGVYRLWDAHSKYVSERVGDKAEWLSWYSTENEMGAKGLVVHFDDKGERVILPIKTLEDLVRILYTP